MQEDKNVKKKGFFKGMFAELKKVIWPTGKQTVRSTAVTILFVLIISLALIVLNLVFGWMNSKWISALTGNDTVIDSNVITNIEDAISGEQQVEDITDEVEEVISGEVISE